jgi:hypothetical protein
LRQVVFDNDLIACFREFDLCRGRYAAKGAHERLLDGIPLRFAAAGRAGEFLLSPGFQSGVTLHGHSSGD